MPLSNSALFYRFQNLYVDLDLHANARLQGNAAQSIRPNEIIWGCMPRTPPPSKKLRAYGSRAERVKVCSKCIGQILGLDPALLGEHISCLQIMALHCIFKRAQKAFQLER